MPALMIMGTASAVGKSTLTLGLLRLLRQRGYKVAPFKALNVTDRLFSAADGMISLGQSMQCEAAGIEPSVAHNPLVISFGKNPGMIAFGNRLVGAQPKDYRHLRLSFREQLAEAYWRMAATYDVVVIEGAGSPVELNLLPDDFVNTGMAAIAEAKVLLVGDIARGGIFASLIGTLDLFPAEDRARVAGLVVNRFQGKSDLFAEGIRILEERTRLPVLGVIPELAIDLEGEDLLSGDSSLQTRLSRAYRETEYDKLAATLAEALDMAAIEAMIRA